MRARNQSGMRHQLVLSIGGVVGRLEIVGAVAAFLEQLRARYGTFEMPGSQDTACDFSLRLELRSAPPPGKRDGLTALRERPLTVRSSARVLTIDRWDVSARLRAEGRGSRVRFRGRGYCEMSPFAVDCILRVLWATILPRKGGLLVHACGLRHAEVAVVFPGPSGRGKTTLARKAPDTDDVLSDELCVVRRMDDGWRVHGTPFWGDFARGGTSMRSWPLRTIAFLTQAPRDVVTMTPIMSAEATFRLLECFLAFTTDADTVERNLLLAIQLCAEIRTVEASLTKNVPAAAIFRKLGPHLGPEVKRKVPPANAREMISEFRSLLRKEKSYAFKPRGAGVLWPRSGQSLLVQSVGASDLGPGDIALYWSPGTSPDDDTLSCHRVGEADPKVGKRVAGGRAELLGKVNLIARDGKTFPIPGRIGELARVFGSLVAAPIMETRTVQK